MRASGRLLRRLADLIEQNAEQLARLETLDNGKPLFIAKAVDVCDLLVPQPCLRSSFSPFTPSPKRNDQRMEVL
jgi:hypothetical protein